MLPERRAVQVDGLVRQEPPASMRMRVDNPVGAQVLEQALREDRPGLARRPQRPQLEKASCRAQRLRGLLQHVGVGPGRHILHDA